HPDRSNLSDELTLMALRGQTHQCRVHLKRGGWRSPNLVPDPESEAGLPLPGIRRGVDRTRFWFFHSASTREESKPFQSSLGASLSGTRSKAAWSCIPFRPEEKFRSEPRQGVHFVPRAHRYRDH